MKRIISLVTVIMLLVTMMSGISVQANETVSSAAEYKKTVFEEDFEGDTYSKPITCFNCNNSSKLAELTTETNGNKYMAFTYGWDAAAFEFEPIKTSKFEINFDFYYDAEMSVFAGYQNSGETYAKQTVLWVDNSGKAFFNGDPTTHTNIMNGESQTTLTKNNWYSYHAVLDDSTTSINIEIKDANGAVVGTATKSGIARKTGSNWQGWVKAGTEFKQLIARLNANLDNIVIKEISGYAQIFYDGAGENVNIQSYAFIDPSTPIYINKEGIQTLQISGGSSYYARISVAPAVFDGEKATPSKITVSYYDEGSGFMTLRYTNKDGSYKDAEKVDMTDTKTWKEYSFYLDDIIYKKSQGGLDFEVAGWSESYGASNAFYIRSVKIEKCEPRAPISFKVTSERRGNIFSTDENKTLKAEFANWYDKACQCKIYYSVCDGYKNVIQKERVIEKDFAKGESFLQAINIDLKKNGTYYLALRTENAFETGDESTKSDTQYFDFSVSNKFAESEEPNKNLGAIAHSDHPHYVDEIYKTSDLMADAGFGNMREEIRWGNVETTKGEFNIGHEWIKTVSDKQDLLMILAFGNDLYDNGAFPDDTYPGTKAGFLEYVDTVTKEFKGKVKYYEFWNEPNLEEFGKQCTPESYAKTLQEVYKIVKENDPDAKVAAFATAQPSAEWIRKSLNAGALGYFDAVSTHPYDWDTKFDAKTYKEKLQSLHKLLEEFGIGDTPILLSEMGISSAWNTPRIQAAQIVQCLALTDAEDIADKLYIYNFTEKGVAKGVENNFGIVKSLNHAVPNAAKDAYISVAAYNKMLANAELKDKIVKDDKTFVYRFKNQNGKDVVMFWTEYGSENFGLNLGADLCEMYDMEGNMVAELKATDGIFSLTSSFEPTYLVGEFSKLEETLPKIDTDLSRISVEKNFSFDVKYKDLNGRSLKPVCDFNGNIVKDAETFEEGGGKLVFTVGDAPSEEELIRISLYNNDECVYSALYHAIAEEHDVPEVASVKFFEGEKEVCVPTTATDVIRIEFSEAMNVETLTKDNVSIEGDEKKIAYNGELLKDKKTFAIKPIGKITAGQYVLKINGAESAYSQAIKENYSQNIKFLTQNLVFEEDFEGETYSSPTTCLVAENYNPKAEIATETDGNKYISFTNSWSAMAFNFDPINTSEFEIDFDFYYDDTMAVFAGWQNGGDLSTKQTVLWVDSSGKASFDGNGTSNTKIKASLLAQTTLEKNKWYSYHAVLDDTARSIDITLKDKQTGTVVGTANKSGIARKTTETVWNGWIKQDGEFKQLIAMFGANLDNISITKSTYDPEYSMKIEKVCGVDSEKEIKNLSDLTGDKVEIEFKGYNTYQSSQKAKLLTAYYTGEQLLRCSEALVEAGAGFKGSFKQNFDITAPEATDKIKFMLWNDLEGITPLCEYAELN